LSYLPIRVWTDFQSAVRLLSAEASPKEVLDLILNWIKRNRKFFLSGSFAVYGFEEFLGLSGEEMPVNFSNFSSSELENFKKFTFKYQAKDVDYIAQFLRDVIETLITVEVDKKCPNCNSEGMHVFIGKYNNLVAYQCNVCGHSQYSDGSKVEVGGLEFITERKLRDLKLI